jgi:hypothetical protein
MRPSPPRARRRTNRLPLCGGEISTLATPSPRRVVTEECDTAAGGVGSWGPYPEHVPQPGSLGHSRGKGGKTNAAGLGSCWRAMSAAGTGWWGALSPALLISWPLRSVSPVFGGVFAGSACPSSSVCTARGSRVGLGGDVRGQVQAGHRGVGAVESHRLGRGHPATARPVPRGWARRSDPPRQPGLDAAAAARSGGRSVPAPAGRPRRCRRSARRPALAGGQVSLSS